ncbi:type I-E CRISPR-associated protein Cas7/Cse4/CasC [endosymbiont of Ridgeia piscesae]|jgi:CRISPR system Cascade subunit CasC|uniref:CRISPR-associated protein, Cse4 family n=1 Tax=endosymbiont of Ridgeia piscesae TaxID=54398 RepID=A0A0T5ZB95_9GAMM|nr:type I-E CRISPR-associated protein Cas7/Cse4/CasC [endosymbiont of Ridgeia piscesae]KRT54281.1 CRISPR-associated protein, Cse4 family [endosymbiont of Ridgeia piscesae]KRT59758.1 CRISPR-associated protein, Cse4 family [endosymbiont of Ridgeia piscesae]
MTQFVQLHLLTSYPPANLNRDDLGRPKTAMMGGANRLRVSSQSLKRAWRTSDSFEQALKDHLGTRTKEMGPKIYQSLIDKDVSGKKAMDWAKQIAGQFGKLKSLSKKELEAVKQMEEPEKTAKLMVELEIEQLAHFSPEELAAIDALVDELAASGEAPTQERLALLRERHTAADIALFGRMLASSPKYNTEAAAQVAHAISVHKVTVEDDFFTAVDDLNNGEEDMGAGHMGETEFAAGLFYQYICIDRDLLRKNLSGDTELADKTLDALIRAAATVAPGGKQNSFASRARASYILCERGEAQPRSLSVAFLKPVAGQDLLTNAIDALEQTRERMDAVYGDGIENPARLNARTGEGSLDAIIACATGD